MSKNIPQYLAHPWHGVAVGSQAPEVVTCFIEIVPTDTVKYEVDKESGHLKVDRPQKYSNHCPTLYGFVPQTFCGERVGKFCSDKTGRPGIEGDGDPLDICVLTEKPITHGNILVRATPIGGLRMIDNDQADDKIIAVLHDDSLYGKWRTLSDCPPLVIDRLRHYFLTYKDLPGAEHRKVEVAKVYDRDEACRVIELSVADYQATFNQR